MGAAEILNACLSTGDEASWQAFVARFQPLIASNVSRVVRRYGNPSPALVDDLIQETYLRLCRDNCHALRKFQGECDESIFGYLKVIATSVALDHFRARATHKRREEVENDGSHREPATSADAIERSALLHQMEDCLASTESERDRAIFWLYYRQGFTAEEIAAMTGAGLSPKGVESALRRVTKWVRAEI